MMWTMLGCVYGVGVGVGGVRERGGGKSEMRGGDGEVSTRMMVEAGRRGSRGGKIYPW